MQSRPMEQNSRNTPALAGECQRSQFSASGVKNGVDGVKNGVELVGIDVLDQSKKLLKIVAENLWQGII